MNSKRPVKVPLHEQVRISSILKGIQLAKKDDQQHMIKLEAIPVVLPKTAADISNPEDDTCAQCLTCKCNLAERKDQTLHYKSDWHRYNIKLRLLGQPTINEEEFGDGVPDETLSISGSDTEDDLSGNDVSSDENRRLSVSLLKSNTEEDNIHDQQFDNRRPKIYFQNSDNNIVSVYKKVLYSRQNSDVDSDITDVAKEILESAHCGLWVVILFSAGHFAAAIFESSKVVVHKTFHRYIVRAKRGTVQSVNDSSNRGNKAKSAGANLRRHNELALDENIRTLLKSWKEEYFDKCSHIFLRIPHYRKSLFYGGKDAIFEQKDARIRSVPFITRRPTFNEVQRVFQELFCVSVHDEQSMTEILSSPTTPSNEEKRTMSKVKQGKKKDEALKSNLNTEPADKKHTTETVLPNARTSFSEDSIELLMQDTTLSTEGLKLFHTSVTKNKNKKKQKKKELGTEKNNSVDPIPQTPVAEASKSPAGPLDHVSPVERELMNKLFTACKTFNLDMFDENLRLLQTELNIDKPKLDTSAILSVLGVEALKSSADEAVSKDAKCITHKDIANMLAIHLDSSGNTLLHIASKSGNKQIIYKLLEAGADPSVKNFSSFLPYCICSNKEARNAYRRFRAKYPDRYDYKKANVPSPLTDDKVEEMKKKKIDKKKAQIQSKRNRDRQLKEEEEKSKEEQSEKERFLALSDREKRLIAVERRLLNDPNTNLSNARRCYTCAESLFAKVPFEYFDYKFCSMSCLKAHKATSRT